MATKRKAKRSTPKTKPPEADPLTETPKDLEEHWADVAPGKRIPSMSRKDLAQFVMDFCDNKLFTSAHLPKHSFDLAPMIFMPLALGGLKSLYEAEAQRIGLIWEYYSAAGPRSINGYPMFFSCRIMTKDDWDTARKAIKRETERREKATETVLDEELGPVPPAEAEPSDEDHHRDP